VPVQYLRAGEAPDLTGGLEAEIGGLSLFWERARSAYRRFRDPHAEATLTVNVAIGYPRAL